MVKLACALSAPSLPDPLAVQMSASAGRTAKVHMMTPPGSHANNFVVHLIRIYSFPFPQGELMFDCFGFDCSVHFV
jgi:hypothetical protein